MDNSLNQHNDLVLVTIDTGVMTIQLNRPAKKNALNLDMYRAMTSALRSAVEDSGVRVILFAGSEGCFTSGNDLADFAGASDLLAADNPIVTFMAAMSKCPKPVVVAVDGLAVGIGTTLLMHSDLVYASPASTFKLPFVSLGLCPEFGASFLLPRIVGYAKATQWLLFGEFFSSSEALDAGLINEVVEKPLAYAKAQSMTLAQQAPAAVRSAKALMRAPLQPELDQVITTEIELFTKALQGEEFKEAVTAFFEKRQPNFSNCA